MRLINRVLLKKLIVFLIGMGITQASHALTCGTWAKGGEGGIGLGNQQSIVPTQVSLIPETNFVKNCPMQILVEDKYVAHLVETGTFCRYLYGLGIQQNQFLECDLNR